MKENENRKGKEHVEKRETAYTVCRLNSKLIGEGSARSITKETRQ